MSNYTVKVLFMRLSFSNAYEWKNQSNLFLDAACLVLHSNLKKEKAKRAVEGTLVSKERQQLDPYGGKMNFFCSVLIVK